MVACAFLCVYRGASDGRALLGMMMKMREEVKVVARDRSHMHGGGERGCLVPADAELVIAPRTQDYFDRKCHMGMGRKR